MGGFSGLVRRPAAASGPTHALFAAQSHSIVDNLVALLRYRRALDCSPANCMRLVHSRFLVPSGHACMAPVLLNVTQTRPSLAADPALCVGGRAPPGPDGEEDSLLAELPS